MSEPAQATLDGATVQAEPTDSGRCQFVDESVKRKQWNPDSVGGQSPPARLDGVTGRCERDAVVMGRSGSSWILACHLHAEPEWKRAIGETPDG